MNGVIDKLERENADLRRRLGQYEAGEQRDWREMAAEIRRSEAHATLGSAIEDLSAIAGDWLVYFDVLSLVPRSLQSYRGFYDHLALGFDARGHDHVTAEALRRELAKAVGAHFTGYKGGTFRMDATTPLWMANGGDVTERRICGFLPSCGYVRIITVGELMA